MLHIPITKDVLRKAAEDSLKRNEIGLLIWATDARWQNLREKVAITNPFYKLVMKELQNGHIMWANFSKDDWIEAHRTLGERNPLLFKNKSLEELIVPVSKLVADNDFCDWVAHICNAYPLQGPITTLPAMHLSSIYFNPSLLN